MKRKFFLTGLLLVFFICKTYSQTIESLRQKIQQVLSSKNAVVGVSIIGNDGKDTLSINGERHFPLQSVYKFFIALEVLSQVDKGKFYMGQKIKISKTDLLPNLYSPIRDKYPDGVTLAMSEILEYMVSESDNVACDVLLRQTGGPQVVEDYFYKNGFKDLAIKTNEEWQQAHWDIQFKNWTTPKQANEVLISYYRNDKKLLSKKSYEFIWKVMKETKTGGKRLRGQLPENTMVAHKTGSSGRNKDGVTAAVNDIGIIFMPNGQHYFISVFVTDSMEDGDANEKIISDISRATWDYFIGNLKYD